LPTAQNLRSAFRWGKKIKIKSRSKAEARRPDSRPDFRRARVSLWEPSLLAMTASQPTDIFMMHPDQMWELACQRWRPDSRPDFRRARGHLWEPSLLAMTASQPTDIFLMHPDQMWELACQRWRPDWR
jgi:hypothetical protein